MKTTGILLLGLSATAAFGQPAGPRDAKMVGTMVVTPGANLLPARLDMVIIGKVVEIDRETATVAPHKGARVDQAVTYKVATLKIEDPVFGAAGVTRVRVGFIGDVPTDTLVQDMEGCFSLARHPTADFHVLVNRPIQKKEEGYAKALHRQKAIAAVVNDPVAALKAKDLDERFEAAAFLLQHYLIPRVSTAKEPIPEEENKLILALLQELPWSPPPGTTGVRPDGRLVPHRGSLWNLINAGELGFKRPERPKRKPGDPPVDFNALIDEATSKFLKENADKIKLKRFVQK
jgi:hypothetical protein